MPKHNDIKKVLVIGSGPIIIGQAAEFDYAGTQACRTLQEEHVETILINSNPATIMTDAPMASRIYLEPLTPETVRAVISKERPDSLLATLGGQVGLNLAMTLSRDGTLAREEVRLLGTSLDSIEKAEDRERFKQTMEKIGEPVPESAIVSTIDDALHFARSIGYPVIVRPGYTMGGTGGGVAHDDDTLTEIAAKGLTYSINSQLLIERSVAGWKEIEFEVMRDSADTCITICSMENVDPVGIHTGDSIVVAPTQTLSDKDFRMMRQAALSIIRELAIEGGCNIQFALHPYSSQYYVIEVNPRVSRSSALASKATGYPIAKVATRIALGYTLDEIPNTVTGTTTACFEPTIDYIVAKIPRWPFDKFTGAQRALGSQMKATGEVMALGRNFSAALLKAIYSLEANFTGLLMEAFRAIPLSDLLTKIEKADDERLFLVAEALRRGVSIEQINKITKIDYFFLNEIIKIVNLEKNLSQLSAPALLDALASDRDRDRDDRDDHLSAAKAAGFSDFQLAHLLGVDETAIAQIRRDRGIIPGYLMVDTCAGEFPAVTPYYYSSFGEEGENHPTGDDKILVLGSGPIRIGQGIEFDYCSVHASHAIREMGYKSIVINNNPETVSTDPDTSDRLYFEPLNVENVMSVIDQEHPLGVVVQFGGQTAINLAKPLLERGVAILGTGVEDIDRAENREKFDDLLETLRIPRPKGNLAHSHTEAHGIATSLGFPVLVRPSYVLGGRAMEIVYNETDLADYLAQAVRVSPEHPVLVDRYMMGREVEVDAVADGENVLIPGIMEHLERAGIHSGDSIAIYPPQTLTPALIDTLTEYTTRIALALRVKGLLNIQFIIQNNQIYVIEVNPRASRTVPILSKVTGIPLVKLATRIQLGETLSQQGYSGGLYPNPNLVAVKIPVFSFNKLTDVEPSLGPEMKSTGEVLGLAETLPEAMYKGFLGAGYRIPHSGDILVTLADKDKEEALPHLTRLSELGFGLRATSGTATFLRTHGLPVSEVSKIHEGSPNVIDIIRNKEVVFVINTLTRGKQPLRDGFQMRRMSVEFNIPCPTSLDTLAGLIYAIEYAGTLITPDNSNSPTIPARVLALQDAVK
ncbi:MAG: carbamoyl-phosphate synthase large subunit [Peptococcaceae bacterium]|nr:carbamoyl-phosphate synthase large subunit [Peptococcaceae bacterium]